MYWRFNMDKHLDEEAISAEIMSYVKNRIYRTLRELKKYLGKEVDGND